MKRKPLMIVVAVAFALVACTSQSPGIAVGAPAPAFMLPTATGGTVTLADYRNRQPVLLFFHMADG